jgi:hypothetical protein
MRSRPTPQVPHVRSGLIRQEDAGEQREGAGSTAGLWRRQPIEMRAAGVVVPRRDIERDLSLRRQQRQGRDQRCCKLRGAAADQQRKQRVQRSQVVLPIEMEAAVIRRRGVVRLIIAIRETRSRKCDHTAATAFRHSLAASARKIRSVDRETRWR